MIWPFKRRRRGSAPQDAPSLQRQFSEKKKKHAKTPVTPAGKAPSSPSRLTRNPSLARRSSQRGAPSRRRASRPAPPSPIPASPTKPTDASAFLPVLTEKQKERDDGKEKENVPPPLQRPDTSYEDVTALPGSRRLDHSPHLRPADSQRAQIPYNFRPYSLSQTSVQKQEVLSVKQPRPHTLHGKRSTTDNPPPARRASSRLSRKQDNAVREEEIRAMSAPVPIPKRAGDGPLRRESKKVRGLLGRDSEVSLPPEGSIHSGMSGLLEQRGWELSTSVFNPRPAVRLSGTPQYVPSSSLPAPATGMLYRIDSKKDKRPQAPDPVKKRRVVGDEADELDASDLRTIMERDAKRREQRQRERQAKLERKLQDREGRNRGDSDARRLMDGESDVRVLGSRALAQERLQAQGPLTPPTAIHPALRDQPPDVPAVPLGLGIDGPAPSAEPELSDVEPLQREVPPGEEHQPEPETLATHQEEEDRLDPFSDAEEYPMPSPHIQNLPTMSGTSLPLGTPLESPMEEEPVFGTAQAVRLSTATPPPLSPVHRASHSPLVGTMRQRIPPVVSSTDSLPPQSREARRSSDPFKDRRTGTWAAFFRRGGTISSRKYREGDAASPAETGFSNTSRESMRNQPLPAHLVGTSRPPNTRSISGPPVRTQSKFREDLPESPMSPIESRQQLPDGMPAAAAAAAVARRHGKSLPQSVDTATRLAERNDTPVSRGHTAMAASLASINTEGSWLASPSTKRRSAQSTTGGPLETRNPEFVASYEEISEDRGGEDVRQTKKIPATGHRELATLANVADLEEARDEEGALAKIEAEASDEPLTVHGSMRRKPTLVQRDQRLKSREGLVQEYTSADSAELIEQARDAAQEDASEPESIGGDVEVHRAVSVQYSGRHSRQFSAGSAKLLDVQPRHSVDHGRQSPVATSEPSTTTQGQSTDA